MNSLQVEDARLVDDLAKYVEPVRMYDSKGKPLGLFVPEVPEYIKQKYAQLKAMVEADKQRRANRDPSGPTIPHAEVLVRLGALIEEMQRRSEAGDIPFTVDEAKAFLRGVDLF
jgi:hypothetical protein